jgi:hypothetical protein
MTLSLRRVSLVLAVGGAMLGGATLSAAPAAAQSCHPSYGGCLPWYEGDALNCADIGYQVVEVWNVNDDPYRLDTWDGPGNGLACDSYS